MMRKKLKVFGLAFLLAVVDSIAASGARLIYEFSGTDGADALGYSVAGGGDVNGDGKTDFIVGVPFANPGDLINAGQAFVYSGADGSLLFTINGTAAGDRLGGSVGLRGDVNGDGREDFIVGAPYADPGGLTDAGSAYIYSGADGSLIYQKDGEQLADRLGGSVGIYGDLNADGRADFIIGATEADPGGLTDAGSAYIYSGDDGSLIYRKDGGAAGDRLGGSVGIGGDANGDSRGDFIIGAPEANSAAGSVYLYSGSTGTLIFQKVGSSSGNRLGGSVGLTEVTDVNGDAHADLIAGAPGTNNSAGAVFIYSGLDGALMYQKSGSTFGDRLGGSVGIQGDVNNDGKADFIVGASGADFGSNADAGLVFVYSGNSGGLLYQKNGTAIGDGWGGFGSSVGIMGDADLDGFAEFIAGAPAVDSSTGLAQVYSGATGNLLYQQNGRSNGDMLGSCVANAGDVNGDGTNDFIVAAVLASPGGRAEAGSIFVYSGDASTLLFQKDGAAAGDNFGVSAAGAGDVDGDGKADFIVGAYLADPGGLGNAGSAYLYSGLDGHLLYQKDGAAGDRLGRWVAGVGDVNGDGKADFIVGAPLADPGGLASAGSVYLYSGATGALLYQKDGAEAMYVLGRSVAGAGDVDGDGRADFIIGSTDADPGGRPLAGSAYIYSGATGTLLYQKDGAAADDRLGRSVAGAGDVDGDGRADFIIGAPGASPGGRLEAGSAYLYSGATGDLIYQKDGAGTLYDLGFSVAGAGDMDGDGRTDFIVGAFGASPDGRAEAGSAYIYSGATGALLHQEDGAVAFDCFGWSVAGAGDVDGNGRFIVGACMADPGGRGDAGSAFVYGFPACVAAKGDMNCDGILKVEDVVLMLNCVFLGEGLCALDFADVNCDGVLRPADVVLELLAVFLSQPFPCR